MSSAGERESPARAYGLRLGVWYATLFIAGSLTIVYLTYVLTSASLGPGWYDVRKPAQLPSWPYAVSLPSLSR